MTIPTEPIGSIPRPLALLEAIARSGNEDPALDDLYEQAIQDTIARFEATGSPVITDGEQRKYQNFWTYSVPLEQLGTTDDCGYSPFCDDTSTSRDVAFEKIEARVSGTQLAAKILGVS